MAPGESTSLNAKVTHEGSEAPWPDFDSYELPGRVRLVTLITPRDGEGVPGGRSGGELSHWMWPGDTSTVEAEVRAIDEAGAPLPPGLYDVELAIAQEGSSWVAPGGDGARFVLDVRP